MAENGTKPNVTKPNDAENFSVTIGVTLSEQEQIDAAKQKAVAFNAANPDKLVAIGKPSATRDGLKVEFGVTK
jgi:hypothetical protein